MSRSETGGKRVLIFGGSGVFGSRLVSRLLYTTRFSIIVAGRDRERLDTFVKSLVEAGQMAASADRVSSLVWDIKDVRAERLKETGAFVVVDAAGPFQNSDYRVARAAIEAGIHYLDLADGGDFVAAFSHLDQAAKDARIVAVSGVSSTPTLSNAVLDDITFGWRSVDTVEAAIAPGNRAPRGLAVVQSILSYAGQPVRVFENGQWRKRPGWGLLTRRWLPGLGNRYLSLVETPDLDIIPDRYRVRKTVIFRAGLELPVMHLGLWLASQLVRLKLLRSLAPFAKTLRQMAQRLEKFGVDTGGMMVEATGQDTEGFPIKAVWSLVVSSGEGPFVPVLPAIALLKRLVGGGSIPCGAFSGAGILSLQDIKNEFNDLNIKEKVEFYRPGGSLYEAALGSVFAVLPKPIQKLHSVTRDIHTAGFAQIDGPHGVIARLVAPIFRFPRAGKDIPVSVTIFAHAGQERWTRNFGGKRFTSVMRASKKPAHLIEQFGSLSFEMELSADALGIAAMPVKRWWLGFVPMPLFLAPVSIASETVDREGRFCFDVALMLPLGLGQLVRYRGWLTLKSLSRPIDPTHNQAVPFP